MKPRVYFINPPDKDPKIKMIREGRCMQRSGTWTAIWAPYSLCLGAAILQDLGIECKVSDCVVEEMDFKKLESEISKFNPDAVIINTSTPSIDNDLETARFAKRINPRILTIAIGIHPTELTKECFDMEPGLDLIIRGEMEETLRELFKSILKKKKFDKLKGIAYRKKGKIVINKNREYIKSLDWLPIPAWNLVNLKYYTLPFSDKPFLLLGTARGCPYNCKFCTAKPYYGRGLRYRDVGKIVDEIEYVKKRYNVDEFLMWTEAFTANKKYCIAICDEIIKRKVGIKFVCNSRVDSIDEEILKKLKLAGCWMIGYGIESGNQEILDRAGKGITLEQSRSAVKLTKKYGIEVTAHCMVGLLGESKETVKQTYRFIKEIDPEYAQFYCAVPMPWTEMYKEAKENNLVMSEDFHLYEQNYSVMHTGKMSPEEVMKAREWIYKKFYLRPIVVFRTLRKIKNFRNLKKFVFMARDFLTWV